MSQEQNMNIHPTAIIHPTAELADNVEVGPYCIINEDVRIDSGTKLMPYVYVDKWTTIGKNNEIHMGTVIGHDPQHQKYKGERTYTKIGDNNIIREHVTIHRSFVAEQSTIIGNNNYLMATAHVAHDCVIGNNCMLCNGELLAGHVVVQDGAFISGNTAIHQFVRIGTLAIIGGLARVSKDAPPFSIIEGNSYFRGINIVGLRRAGYDQKRRQAINQAYRTLFLQQLSLKEALAELDTSDSPDVRVIVDFLRESKRGFCRTKPKLGTTSKEDNSSTDEDDD
jgi:UDP-N-acetylglucosamine acyltransferase